MKKVIRRRGGKKFLGVNNIKRNYFYTRAFFFPINVLPFTSIYLLIHIRHLFQYHTLPWIGIYLVLYFFIYYFQINHSSSNTYRTLNGKCTIKFHSHLKTKGVNFSDFHINYQYHPISTIVILEWITLNEKGRNWK